MRLSTPFDNRVGHPEAVAAVVNFILSIKTSIPSSGGVHSAPVSIVNRSDYAPQLAASAIKTG